MKSLIIPGKIKPGSTIGIIAPASSAGEIKTRQAVEFAKALGYQIKEGKSIYASRGYLAGEDNLRAGDINEMFKSKDIDAIICIRGGYGTPRILDKIDYSVIRKNPKIFIGYSDITALHIAIHQKAGLLTFHGPMLASDFVDSAESQSIQYLIKMLESKNECIEIVNPMGFPIKSLTKGKARGKLIGGNLAMICSTIGTPYEIDTKNCLLFLEDIGEEPYKIDRMLTQLRLAGKLRDANGIILCSFTDCHASNESSSLSLQQVIKDIIIKCCKPVLMGYMAGHCKPNITIPIGAEAVMNCESLSLTVKHACVK